MLKTLLLAAAVAMVTIPVSSASAADIWVEKMKGDKTPTLFFKGTIENGDQRNFDKLAAKLKPGTIFVLYSLGGALADGLNMGITIWNKRFRTVVVNTCQSACALMWLAGVERGVYSDSSIGFHSAAKTGGEVATGGNAIVGAYLSRLGFRYETIYALTEAAPDDMH